jgi:hypothetical protein
MTSAVNFNVHSHFAKPDLIGDIEKSEATFKKIREEAQQLIDENLCSPGFLSVRDNCKRVWLSIVNLDCFPQFCASKDLQILKQKLTDIFINSPVVMGAVFQEEKPQEVSVKREEKEKVETKVFSQVHVEVKTVRGLTGRVEVLSEETGTPLTSSQRKRIREKARTILSQVSSIPVGGRASEEMIKSMEAAINGLNQIPEGLKTENDRKLICSLSQFITKETYNRHMDLRYKSERRDLFPSLSSVIKRGSSLETDVCMAIQEGKVCVSEDYVDKACETPAVIKARARKAELARPSGTFEERKEDVLKALEIFESLSLIEQQKAITYKTHLKMRLNEINRVIESRTLQADLKSLLEEMVSLLEYGCSDLITKSKLEGNLKRLNEYSDRYSESVISKNVKRILGTEHNIRRLRVRAQGKIRAIARKGI